MSIYVEHMCVVILAGDCSKKYICVCEKGYNR